MAPRSFLGKFGVFLGTGKEPQKGIMGLIFHNSYTFP